MKRPPPNTPPAAVEKTLQLWIWIDARLPHLPAFARASAGAKFVEALLVTLDHLTRAAWLPARSAESLAALREANHRIAFARLLLRGMRERAYLSVDQHAYAAEELESIGRMVGAWLRAQSERRA